MHAHPRRPSGRGVYLGLHVVVPIVIWGYTPAWPSGPEWLPPTAAALWGLTLLVYCAIRQMPIGVPHAKVDEEGTQALCDECGRPQPLRSHHCHQCNVCVPAYDHHCWWTGVCIGARTRALFLLFLHLELALLLAVLSLGHPLLPYRLGLKPPDKGVVLQVGWVHREPLRLGPCLAAAPLYLAAFVCMLNIVMVAPLIVMQWFMLVFNATSRELIKPHECRYLNGLDEEGYREDCWAALNTFNRGCFTNCIEFAFPPEEWVPVKPNPAPPTWKLLGACSGLPASAPSDPPDRRHKGRDSGHCVLYLVLSVLGYLAVLYANRVWPSPAHALTSPGGIAATSLFAATLWAFREVTTSNPGFVIDRAPEIDASKALGYCGVCRVPKPLRSSHCEQCGRCVYTWDHHCGWMGRCIGGNNRPLFLRYIALQAATLWAGALIVYKSLAYSVGPVRTYAYVVPLDWGVSGPANDNAIAAEVLLHLLFWAVLLLALATTYLTHKQVSCCCLNLTSMEHTWPWVVPYMAHAVDEDGFVDWFRVALTFHQGMIRNLQLYFFEKPINWQSRFIDLAACSKAEADPTPASAPAAAPGPMSA